MRSVLLKIAAFALIAISAAWLFGYARVVWPFASDYLRDPDFSFLTFPNVKFYRVADQTSGKMSALQVDLFSVSDGPTGVEYNELYLPCWMISLGATGGLALGGCMLFFSRSPRPSSSGYPGSKS